jgi:hypothetical protein
MEERREQRKGERGGSGGVGRGRTDGEERGEGECIDKEREWMNETAAREESAGKGEQKKGWGRAEEHERILVLGAVVAPHPRRYMRDTRVESSHLAPPAPSPKME